MHLFLRTIGIYAILIKFTTKHHQELTIRRLQNDYKSNQRFCNQIHAAVCGAHDFRGSASAML